MANRTLHAACAIARSVPRGLLHRNPTRSLVQHVGPSQILHTQPYRVVKPEITIGAVAYSPDVEQIWAHMRNYFFSQQVRMDFVLFTSYEAQVEALFSNFIDIAWNGPIAHVRTQRRSYDSSISLGMRDVDRGFQTRIAVRDDVNVSSVQDIPGHKLATGSVDSPQAYVLPMHFLQSKGLPLGSLEVTRFDRDVGKHGDTAAGEVEVLQALHDGRAEVGLVSQMMWDRAIAAADINNGQGTPLRLLDEAPPVFDHCQFDTLNKTEGVDRFTEALFAMDWNNPEHRKVMQMEGLREKWEEPRETGYDDMREALREEGNTPYPPQLHETFNHPFKSLTIA